MLAKHVFILLETIVLKCKRRPTATASDCHCVRLSPLHNTLDPLIEEIWVRG